MASLFLLQKLKGSISGDVRDFNNIGTRSVIKWPSLNVVIFPPVMRLVLDDPKQ
jgi:hypothetical protein